MPTPVRSVAAVACMLAMVGTVVLSGCAAGGPEEIGAGRDGSTVTLAPNTCWTAETLGADPQTILQLAKAYAVNYFEAAPALADRPAFKLTEACSAAHHVEVYKVIGVNQIQPTVLNYADLLRPEQAVYRAVATAVEHACMNKHLAAAAAATKLPGVVAEPAFPDGVELSWAPPSPDQWARGQRVYACILTAKDPVRFRYGGVFSKSFPTRLRTCIDSTSLVYVDCARKHDRERIAMFDLRAAVAAGAFPGTSAIARGPNGRFVDIAAATLAILDRACTTYLKAVSKTKKLTGVAELDADRWPTANGAYPVDCEADVSPTKKSLITKGSVYDR